MSWLVSKDCEMLRAWVRKNRVSMLAAGQDGRIYWANEAFETLLGYSEYELTQGRNGAGIKWTDISVNDSSLLADQKMVDELVAGRRDDFSVRKQYLPKNDKPIWVEIHVMRWPTGGEVDCFLVTVQHLKDGSQAAAEIAMKAFDDLTLELQSLKSIVVQSLAKLTDAEIMAGAIARTINRYPRASGIVCTVILVMLLGSQLVQAVEATKRMMGMQIDTVKLKENP